MNPEPAPPRIVLQRSMRELAVSDAMSTNRFQSTYRQAASVGPGRRRPCAPMGACAIMPGSPPAVFVA